MNRVYGCEDTVELFEEKDSNGKTIFGFGTYGGIAGLANASEDEEEFCDDTAYDEFINGLQECVADDDAVIILEAGNEKLRYVIGSATIITSVTYEYLDITSLAIDKAAELLGNPKWATKCEY
jgi:hypothetical protein